MVQINWLKSGEPFSEQFQDFYFSTDGGLEETEYVFFKQNGFPQRFKEAGFNQINIGETGFGTGLNFLVTSYHFLHSEHVNCTLNYTSVEKFPFSKIQLQQVYTTFKKSWPQLSICCDELLQHYPEYFDPLNRFIQFKLADGKITLNLLIDNATTGLTQFFALNKSHKIDAWYLDGFAPAKNPDMWQQELFEVINILSKTGTTISSFTSAGIVRRGLIEAGFKMSKAPGLGKKREILFGIKE
ncbi:MAG: tRNA (5-methylaminomethyl-2-thiouridine)(34)-methyltransferase MnmD [gamma proteobacterium symbiont of Bathyaustriella thionipta]|nr:tRNA (5-methylaminomethyl-2-thiouridine)(34)-methyltransferase MnmD [gamma proteobacterium symbiont of Bathyaustriella thionipta]MCU7950260.1 tRNA (5-methylaminomethyl-2-thiouridine)(34)-methyltransferase MnmD [gamma proteobacterium symbiont of Bathyaustriella thionipta]MCU7954685.1 tRNA (5-methylaminomethyl-2-thiouridine)(34)-methyltransferase MnmD [gamma proteobacterium symbiont of Bathyaustriella thionipta]MCU7956818.1 tRNA (5-methylaminomethyl-2-thiouridine)(34)-methyltransferase MnmD [ga